jgi:dihydrofolate reductase
VRKITYGAACSLDGYIATRDGGVSWLRWSDDVERLTASYWQRVDTVLMGRKTYEVARASRGGSGAYPSVMNYVFSTTLQSDPEPGVRLVSTDAERFVRDLKVQPGGEVCVMGGGELARSLFEADLIDEVGANVHPILLGDGIPLFHRTAQPRELDLLHCEQIAHHCVYMLYRVVR